MMHLYGLTGTRSDRVLWMLKELEVEFEYTQLNIMKGEASSAEMLKLCPTGKIPFVTDRDFTLFESLAIVNYLAEKYPEKNLIPKPGTFERAKYDQWMFMASNEIDPRFAAITGQLKFTPENERLPSLIDLCKSSLERTFKIADTHLANNDYLLGNKFTAVDVVYGHFASWEKWLEIDLTGPFKNLSAYLERVQKRSSCPWNKA